MSAPTLDSMIPDAIKLENALRFSQTHQAKMFQFNPEEPNAWQTSWDFLIERLDIEEEKPALKLYKGETQSEQDEVFVLDLHDIDEKWWMICHHFEIEEWSIASIQARLEEDFYGSNLSLKHPESGEEKLLSEHIADFLTKYPNGGTNGVICDMSELFTLEEISA